MTPYINEINAWFDKFLKPLPQSEAKPLPSGKPVNPDTNMMRYFQRRIAKQTAAFTDKVNSLKNWEALPQRYS